MRARRQQPTASPPSTGPKQPDRRRCPVCASPSASEPFTTATCPPASGTIPPTRASTGAESSLAAPMSTTGSRLTCQLSFSVHRGEVLSTMRTPALSRTPVTFASPTPASRSVFPQPALTVTVATAEADSRRRMREARFEQTLARFAIMALPADCGGIERPPPGVTAIEMTGEKGARPSAEHLTRQASCPRSQAWSP